jgi:DNA-binding winged helix-turn-helix (wHTH) protein
MFELAGQQIQRLTLEHVAQVLAQLLIKGVERLVAERKLEPEVLSGQYDWLRSNSAQPLKRSLGAISDLLTAAKLRHALYLFDQIDEVPIIQQQPAAMEHVLTILLAQKLREAHGLALNYFLPHTTELLLTGNAARFRLDRCEVASIQWTAASLKKLIQRRLKAFSRDRLIGCSSLGELCEGGGDFARSIDEELAELASGSPRAALWLANRLFMVHCENDKPPRQIQSASWERVKTRWYRDGRRRFFPDTPFWLYGNRLFYWEREIALKARSRQLLICLIRTEERVCDRFELAKAGWAGDQPEGVSKRAIDEAVRRMKIELFEQGIDSNWVHTVRSQGYRLASPTDITTPEDKLEGIDNHETR